MLRTAIMSAILIIVWSIARKYGVHVTEHSLQFRVWHAVLFMYVDCYRGCFDWRTGQRVSVPCGARIVGVSWNHPNSGFKQYAHKVKIWV